MSYQCIKKFYVRMSIYGGCLHKGSSLKNMSSRLQIFLEFAKSQETHIAMDSCGI